MRRVASAQQLPDFSALFARDKVSRLHLRIRHDSNYPHDIAFLSGYLHDARLTPHQIVRRGKKLVIPLQRDCWELGITDHPGSCELPTAKARLLISPVSSLQWEIQDIARMQEELWLESIYLGPIHWEAEEVSELVISGRHQGWKLRVSIADDFGEIRLDDLELPYLWSARNP